MKTRAIEDGDAFILNGRKSLITNGPVGDLFLIYAKRIPMHEGEELPPLLSKRAAMDLPPKKNWKSSDDAVRLPVI
jgi:alkylation response protein AidB-like acyl-CoA dehydrogenase